MKQIKYILAVGGVMAMLAACATNNYPIKTCVVSGEELGSMGDPIVLVHEGTTVKLCCEGCKEDFEADPDKFLKIVAGEAPYPKPEE